MTAQVLVADPEAVRVRAESLRAVYRPSDAFGAWLVEEAATISVRLGGAEGVVESERIRAAERAELTWDDDRDLAVEKVASRLRKDPEGTVLRLKSTPHGLDWLVRRWRLLEASATEGGWSAEEAVLAVDLLGVPEVFRGEPEPLTEAQGLGGQKLSELARAEIAALEDDRDRVADLDERDRLRVAEGLAEDLSPEHRRARRYETTLFNRLKWCLDRLEAGLGNASIPARAPSFRPSPPPKVEKPAEQPVATPPVEAPPAKPSPEPAQTPTPAPTTPPVSAPTPSRSSTPVSTLSPSKPRTDLSRADRRALKAEARRAEKRERAAAKRSQPASGQRSAFSDQPGQGTLPTSPLADR